MKHEHKHKQFFKLLHKIPFKYKGNLGVDENIDISKLLLGFDTVLPHNIIFEDMDGLSQHGKRLIHTKTHNELDYYFELLRIYYVNYKRSKDQFIQNNITFKRDCMQFITDNDITITYNNLSNFSKSGKESTNGTDSTTDESNNFEEDSDNPETPRNLETESNNDENEKDVKNSESEKVSEFETSNSISNNLEQYAIVPYQTLKTNNGFSGTTPKKSSVFWKRLFRLISLYTHPDKTRYNVLHYLFSLVSKKYEEGKNYFMIFIIKLLEIDHKLPKKYRNFEKKNKSRYNGYIKELNEKVEDLWQARLYFVKCPVYNYHKMTDVNKTKLIKICLTKNVLEFKPYRKFKRRK